MSTSPAEIRELERVGRNLAGLRLQARLLRGSLALKAGFNPNQPRVPAGNPAGGRWTTVGTGVAGRAQRSVVRDDSGQESWETVVSTHRPDGSITGQTVVNRDGSAIRSEFSASPAATGWTERHTVLGADGDMITVENAGPTQRILDANGRLLSASTWTARGPEPEPVVQPAFLPLAVEAATATVELGMTLYTWLSTRNGPGQQAVIAFSAREYRPGESSLGLDYVGLLERDDVDAACPRLDEVQARTDEAVETVKRRGAIDLTPSTFGTAVHMNLKHQIDDLDDPDFRAEVSVLKSLDETYGTKDSVRVDVLENVDGLTVCVYDIKTGKSRLLKGRAAEIARKVFESYRTARRIIVIETRPAR